jgi:Uma2 family endonuclease
VSVIVAHVLTLRNATASAQSTDMRHQPSWTAAAVRELTREDRPWPRYELIDGTLLVTPAPRGLHQAAVVELMLLLDPYVSRVRIGVTMLSPADLELRAGTITQPDVFVIPRGVAQTTRTPEWSDVSALLLAVEVLSESSVRTDRELKRDFYLANHVAEYWVVDTDARTIERWRTNNMTPDVLRDTLVWQPDASEPLVIDVPALFDRIETRWQSIAAITDTGDS